MLDGDLSKGYGQETTVKAVWVDVSCQLLLAGKAGGRESGGS